MICIKEGNLLKAEAEALVNTVNTVGVMGKGIALQFREAYPENYKAYKSACNKGDVQIGKMYIYFTNQLDNPKYIINFPTKNHWREKSKLSDLELGLIDLKNIIKKYEIKSIAIPPLGCGSGGLNWKDVKKLITRELQVLENTEILLFEPKGSPDVDDIPVKTKKPELTPSRASLIYLIYKYALPGYRLSLLEVQKLMYFMQESGEGLRLNYEKNYYGPYAENLNFVIQKLEGHYIRGYGDRNTKAQIKIIHNSENIAKIFLEKAPDTSSRVNKVIELIQGFETPYGMELLTTVHWLVKENRNKEYKIENIVQDFQNWSLRKRTYFKPEHIKIAYDRLASQGWI